MKILIFGTGKLKNPAIFGLKQEEIDAEYLVLKRLTEEDIELIHSRIFKNNRK